MKKSATWPWVTGFARRMEEKLEENRHKGDREGWARDSAGDLLSRIDDELRELRRAVFARYDTSTKGANREEKCRRVSREAADVANFAMMLADVAGDLKPEVLPLYPSSPTAHEEASVLRAARKWARTTIEGTSGVGNPKEHQALWRAVNRLQKAKKR